MTKTIVAILQANNQMEFGLLKIKSIWKMGQS
jgi:hypothetical protein